MGNLMIQRHASNGKIKISQKYATSLIISSYKLTHPFPHEYMPTLESSNDVGSKFIQGKYYVQAKAVSGFQQKFRRTYSSSSMN